MPQDQQIPVTSHPAALPTGHLSLHFAAKVETGFTELATRPDRTAATNKMAMQTAAVSSVAFRTADQLSRLASTERSRAPSPRCDDTFKLNLSRTATARSPVKSHVDK